MRTILYFIGLFLVIMFIFQLDDCEPSFSERPMHCIGTVVSDWVQDFEDGFSTTTDPGKQRREAMDEVVDEPAPAGTEWK